MNDIDLPILSLSELLVRRKYQNVNNLVTARNTYYDHKNGTFDFQGDILDNATATMAFRVTQFQVNWSFIKELCGSHVFGLGRTEWVKKEKEVREQILVAEEAILEKYHLVGNFMGMPVEKTAERYVSAWKNWNGYKTMGDDEDLLAMYLSPFCAYQQFSNCLDLIEEKLKMVSTIDGPWVGLFDHLRAGTVDHFNQLESFAEGKLVEEK
jgi:hypothetical protein